MASLVFIGQIEAEATKRQKSGEPVCEATHRSGRSTAIAGDIVGVGETAVYKAKRIMQFSQDLAKKVHDGDLSLEEAFRQINPPKASPAVKPTLEVKPVAPVAVDRPVASTTIDHPSDPHVSIMQPSWRTEAPTAATAAEAETVIQQPAVEQPTSELEQARLKMRQSLFDAICDMAKSTDLDTANRISDSLVMIRDHPAGPR